MQCSLRYFPSLLNVQSCHFALGRCGTVATVKLRRAPCRPCRSRCSRVTLRAACCGRFRHPHTSRWTTSWCVPRSSSFRGRRPHLRPRRCCIRLAVDGLCILCTQRWSYSQLSTLPHSASSADMAGQQIVIGSFVFASCFPFLLY
jgi:hypothetical protein